MIFIMFISILIVFCLINFEESRYYLNSNELVFLLGSDIENQD